MNALKISSVSDWMKPLPHWARRASRGGNMDVVLIITIQRQHQAGPKKITDDLRNGHCGNLADSSPDKPKTEVLPPRTSIPGGLPEPTFLLPRLAKLVKSGWPHLRQVPTAKDVLQLIAESQRATHQIQCFNAQGVDTFSTSHLLPQPKAVGTSKGPILNLLRRGCRIKLGPTKNGLFEQLKRDNTLLQDLSMMDYSLIMALPNVARGNKEGLWNDQLLDISTSVFDAASTSRASCVASFIIPAAISSVGLTGVASGGVGGDDWVVICAHSASAESVELRNGDNTLRGLVF
ncbi:hypothetical protein PtA15_1A758 [Puccinia triticina]|uniref:PIPK domain-containing protein n=1 Tax=Puccinia triticina TaxID=208348 RepID=A0ABY7CF06_9BASI|nr:uncharacterized protein PtA15_1A758 [Puccinia triticina]WAQ81417.1 hypothetical protein PtA15_1A758 [Puccinia triticina]